MHNRIDGTQTSLIQKCEAYFFTQILFVFSWTLTRDGKVIRSIQILYFDPSNIYMNNLHIGSVSQSGECIFSCDVRSIPLDPPDEDSQQPA